MQVNSIGVNKTQKHKGKTCMAVTRRFYLDFTSSRPNYHFRNSLCSHLISFIL